MATSPFARFYTWLTEQVDWRFTWHRLPLPLGLLDLIGLRIQLRAKNLYDTYNGPKDRPVVGEEKPRYLVARTTDGTYNDLTVPTMGSVNTRFGRNIPLKAVNLPSDAEVLTPNPRTVSLDLLRRDSFQPATILNLLAASWIQFMVHDWFSHGKNQKENPWQVPLQNDDPWPEHPMTILRTNADTSRTVNSEGLPPTYLNTATHWWDGSQIYGSDEETVSKMRSGVDGKLLIGADGLLPVDPATGTDIAGVSGNWWIGLSMLHHLFTREHNAICDALKGAYPSWSDDELFDHARLANAALMAKIHTVDWTTAILAHPALQIGMRANWWGLETERIYKLLGRISKSEVISGIPGSETDHFGVPYSLTEEFVSVYRMHPLMPDDFSFRSLQGNTVLQERTLPEVTATRAREVLEQISLLDLFYSFGTSYPGAITLHNYPRHLQQLTETDGTLNDLSTTEIIRDRERGVPRYNAFRKLLHRTPVTSFEELTDNPQWVEELRRVYNNDIDQVDLMVGMYAETKPAGFGFSDTAFRVFILMASRRLNSDRFFTVDYNPKVYSQVGFDWVVNNNMTTVLLRQFPELTATLRGVDNPFAPWPKAK